MNLSLFLRLGRVSNLPTVWSNVLAGVLLSGADWSGNSFFLLCAALSSFYVGGMFLNDAFDADYDREHRPERPIPRGEVERTTVYVMGGSLLLLGIMLVAGHGMLIENAVRPEPLLHALALAICIVWYNADHKQTLIGPVLMGVARVYVYTTTAYALTSEPSVLLWYASIALLSYLIGLTFLSQQEDLSRARNLWPAVFLLLPFAYPVAAVMWGGAEPNFTFTAILLTVLFVWILRAIRLLRSGSGPSTMKTAIVSLIAGISLLDGVATAMLGLPEYAALTMAAFVLCLGAQSFVSGT